MTRAVQIFRAREKATGREWFYQQRRTYGRPEFRFALGKMNWAPSLSAARQAAVDVGCFRYVDDPILVTVVGD